MPVGEFTHPRTIELMVKQFETAVNSSFTGMFPAAACAYMPGEFIYGRIE